MTTISADLVGKRVVLVSPHPHAGHSGIVDRYDATTFTGYPGVAVRLDNGLNAGVTNPAHMVLAEAPRVVGRRRRS